jgi:hypothetical protein
MGISFTKAINDFFGRKPNQTLAEFQAELKELTPEDRAYFKREFAKIGIEID